MASKRKSVTLYDFALKKKTRSSPPPATPSTSRTSDDEEIAVEENDVSDSDCQGDPKSAEPLKKVPRDSLSKLYKLLFEFHKDSFPNLLSLARLALVIPFQTADCERGFSCQNVIQTAKRNGPKEDKMTAHDHQM